MATIVERQGPWPLLLALVVVAHVLCSAGHATDSVEVPSVSPMVHAAAEQSGTETASTSAAPHTHSVGEHHSHDSTAGSTADQRGSTAKLWLLLFDTGMASTAALWCPPPRGHRRRPGGGRRIRRRNAARLLLSLCIWRV
ncbi:hypothetical protein HDA32_004612 [Spinactinospora alkalitolerans]|uniref:Uncharacterized protein n=1 Tax=Spinactinospora alkalitolerans TaxID=687207 RepID=A0A852U268_9ACTN|nr:hypothetical protein [Spinactinospora alkalitolerans]NYE49492.1 hypothetical protein [Spinactinospora alkalitolerans]